MCVCVSVGVCGGVYERERSMTETETGRWREKKRRNSFGVSLHSVFISVVQTWLVLRDFFFAS